MGGTLAAAKASSDLRRVRLFFLVFSSMDTAIVKEAEGEVGGLREEGMVELHSRPPKVSPTPLTPEAAATILEGED